MGKGFPSQISGISSSSILLFRTVFRFPTQRMENLRSRLFSTRRADESDRFRIPALSGRLAALHGNREPRGAHALRSLQYRGSARVSTGREAILTRISSAPPALKCRMSNVELTEPPNSDFALASAGSQVNRRCYGLADLIPRFGLKIQRVLDRVWGNGLEVQK